MTEHEVDDFLRTILRRLKSVAEKNRSSYFAIEYDRYDRIGEVIKELLVEGGS